MVPKGTLQHAATTVGGTADGTRRSTVGTLNMGTWAGTGEALAWDIAIVMTDVRCPLYLAPTAVAMGPSVGRRGSHTVIYLRF